MNRVRIRSVWRCPWCVIWQRCRADGRVIPFRPADRRADLVAPEHFAEAKAVPEGGPGQFVGIINELARQFFAHHARTSVRSGQKCARRKWRYRTLMAFLR
jgi:hypothetical protein